MLSKYLKEVCEMEKNRYLLQWMLNIEKEKVAKIIDRKEELIKERSKAPKLEKPPEYQPSSYISPGFVFLISLITGAAIGTVLWFVLCHVIDIFLYIVTGFSGDSWDSWGEGISIVIAVILVVADLCIALYLADKKARDYEKEEREQTELTNERIKAKHEEFRKKMDESIATLTDAKIECDRNISVLQAYLSQEEKTLQMYYALNVVHRKYWNFDAMCKMFEYIQSGRCITLYGPSGAYDTYERERREDIIIEKLDMVLSKLDEIKGTNIMLYRAMQNVSYNLDRVYEGISTYQRTIEGIGRDLGKSIGSLEKNMAASNLLLEINNSNLQQLKEYEEYQNFAVRQSRLNEGHWY